MAITEQKFDPLLNPVQAQVAIGLSIAQLADGADGNSKQGRGIIEALRSGVQLSTLEEFLNVDDLLILRPVFDEEQSEELTREALLLAFRQVGKRYDFNFDVDTTDRIVCSELAYVSFPSVRWPTEKALGRHTISPDNVARMAWDDVPLKLVLLYHDGQRVDPAQANAKMRRLMER